MEIKSIEYLPAITFHKRHGDIDNKFKYNIDYIAITWSKEKSKYKPPYLFSLDSLNLLSFQNSIHGGPESEERGLKWIIKILKERDFFNDVYQIQLITQPTVLGKNFQPVSFWLCFNHMGMLICCIAEVNNTFGEKHSYFLNKEDKSHIVYGEVLKAHKNFHVSPFQDIEGEYEFTFNLANKEVKIEINYTNTSEGLFANIIGNKQKLTNGKILKHILKRPGGGLRVLFWIHWQALRLFLKKAKYRQKPNKPLNELD
jgi:DUF1365 family protein